MAFIHGKNMPLLCRQDSLCVHPSLLAHHNYPHVWSRRPGQAARSDFNQKQPICIVDHFFASNCTSSKLDVRNTSKQLNATSMECILLQCGAEYKLRASLCRLGRQCRSPWNIPNRGKVTCSVSKLLLLGTCTSWPSPAHISPCLLFCCTAQTGWCHMPSLLIASIVFRS